MRNNQSPPFMPAAIHVLLCLAFITYGILQNTSQIKVYPPLVKRTMVSQRDDDCETKPTTTYCGKNTFAVSHKFDMPNFDNSLFHRQGRIRLPLLVFLSNDPSHLRNFQERKP